MCHDELFFFLIGFVDRNEFVEGYTVYLERVNGAPQVVLETSDWRLWNSIDQADEKQKHIIAKLYHRLAVESHQEAGSEIATQLAWEEAEDRKGPIHIANLVFDREYSGITLEDPLLPGSDMDLLNCFMRGETLHAKFTTSLLKQAIKVLQKEPNVGEIATPTKAII